MIVTFFREQMYKKQIRRWGLRRNMSVVQKEEVIIQIAAGDVGALASISDAEFQKIKRHVDDHAKKRFKRSISHCEGD